MAAEEQGRRLADKEAASNSAGGEDGGSGKCGGGALSAAELLQAAAALGGFTDREGVLEPEVVHGRRGDVAAAGAGDSSGVGASAFRECAEMFCKDLGLDKDGETDVMAGVAPEDGRSVARVVDAELARAMDEDESEAQQGPGRAAQLSAAVPVNDDVSPTQRKEKTTRKHVVPKLNTAENAAKPSPPTSASGESSLLTKQPHLTQAEAEPEAQSPEEAGGTIFKPTSAEPGVQNEPANPVFAWRASEVTAQLEVVGQLLRSVHFR